MKEIRLYHGTIAHITRVNLNHTKVFKDFGEGFYTTSDLPQAIKFAQTLRKIKLSGGNLGAKGFVYYFKVPLEELNSLNIHVFSNYSIPWVEYIVLNRTNTCVITDFDVVIGPVADMKTNIEIKKFTHQHPDGGTDEDKQNLIQRLEPWKFVDQYCFKTQKAVDLLNKYKVGGGKEY